MASQNSIAYASAMAVAQESVAGTAETTPIKYDYFTDDPAINPVQNVIKAPTVQNRAPIKNILGAYHMEGSIPQIAEPEGMIGWWLKWALGAMTSAQQGATAAYKHSYTPANALHPFTLWYMKGGTQQVKIPYCNVNTWELSQTYDDALRLSVGIIGQKDEITTDIGTATYSTLAPFSNQMLEVKIATSAAGQAIQAHNVALSGNNGIDPAMGGVHGSRFYNALVPGAREVAGSFDLWFDDDSEYQRFWGSATATSPADTTTPVELVFEWDTGIEAAVGYNYKLTVTVPEAIYESTTVNVGGGRVKQTVTFYAQYDASDTDEIHIDLTNTVVAYTAQESMQAAIALDGTSYTDETTEANEDTANDMTLLPATPVVGDAYFFGGTFPFQQVRVNIGTQGAGSWTVVWKYWDGTAWTALAGVTDGTVGFTAAVGNQDVTFTQPDNWLPTSVNDQEAFYVKAEVTVYSSVTTQPKGTQSWVYE